MQGNYPVYKLSNGKRVKFMCMNKENLELYKDLETGLTNYIRDNNGSWSLSDGNEWGIRKTPLFGVTIIEAVRWDMF